MGSMSENLPCFRSSLTDHVEKLLKASLLDGRLSPGTRLVTREVASQLGVSLTPVREALLRLVACNAVEIAPPRSFKVPVLSVARYVEIADIRCVLEGLAAERTCLLIDEAGIAALHALNGRLQAAKRDGETQVALATSRAFRFALYGGAGMPSLFEMIERLWLRIGPTLNYLYPQKPMAPHTHSYDYLLDALERHDGVGARAAIEHAISAGTAIVIDNLAAAGTKGAGEPLSPAFSPLSEAAW